MTIEIPTVIYELITQAAPDDIPIPRHRQKAAIQAYEEAHSMDSTTYMADTVLAYLQSDSFFLLVLLLVAARIASVYIRRK